MADENIQRMLVQIEATTAGLRRELDKGESSVKRFSDNTDKNVRSAGASFKGMARSVTKIAAPLLGAVSAMEGLQKALEVQRQFDRLNAGLITATGSSEKAAVAFAALQEFAAKTPYSLDQAVEGFSKLVNLGLTPSEKALTSYGNTAAAMGKDLNQMIEAVADASTGEFERLKEFGITSSQQGDKVSLTFRGVTTTIGKSAQEIEGYLMNLGLVDFAGAMDERAKTLDGQISNLGDTWDQTFRLINEKGLGDLMRDAVSTAADALQELNESLDSGQFESYLAAMGDNFDGWGADIQHTLLFLDQEFGIFFRGVGEGAKSSAGFTVEAFRDMPENVRAFIQLMTVEVLAGFDKAQAYAVAFKDSIAAVFSSDTFDDVQKRLQQSLDQTNSVRQGSIEDILAERDTAVQSFKDQTAAADERLRKYREERAESAKSGEDRLAQFSKQTEAAKTLSKEEENKAKQQAKALADLLAQSKISTDAANALADAYLSGQDQLAKFTLQEKISQELLKTGAAARDKVTAAIEGQLNAEARRDVAKATYDLRAETSALDLQAAATLQGKSALEAFNVERAKAAILSGKNVDALTEETRQYLEAFEANQKATKALQQAGEVEGIMDRLQPQAKLLKDYTKEVAALTKTMELDKEHSAQYAETLRLLGLEYEQNRVKATAWGQFTEGAVDRVDEAFADAWKNIGKGFDGFATSLKDGFKQLLAELAHMAITKPIIMQIGAALGVGGLSASQGGGLLGGSGGNGGLNLVSLAQNAYSVYNGLTGVGSAIYGGYQVGGLSGALQGGVGYYGNMLSNGANYVSGLFGGASGAAAGSAAASSAAGATAAGYTGQAYSSWAATQHASQAASKVASTISSYGPYFAAIAGALQGWQAAGFKGAVAGAGGAVGGMYAGAQLGSYFGPIGTAIGGAIGAVAGAAFGSKLFGGSWQTKDAGLMLGVEGGQLDAMGYEYQKKKGGLFGKNKKRTVYNALDEDTQSLLDATFDAGLGQIQFLFEQFGIDVTQSALDGLSVGTTQISTRGKTNEELQQLIGEWFSGTFDSITEQINTAMGSQFRQGLNLDTLTMLLSNLVSVNAGLDQINVTTLKLSPASAYAADALRQFAGGLEQFGANVNTYYQGFFSQGEREDDAISSLRKQFEAMNLVLPETREGYRKLVESMDVTYDAGQKVFTYLMQQAAPAAAIYDVLERRAKEAADAQQALADAQSEAAKAAADAAAQQLEAARLAKISYADAMQQAYASDAQRAMSAITSAIKGEQDALTESYNAQVNALNARISASGDIIGSLSSMTSGLSGALKQLLGQSDAATAMLYQQGRATLETAAAIAKAGGSLANFEGLDQALDAVTGNSADRYSSWEDFARDQGRAANLIDELNKAAGGQLSVEQRTLETLNKQLDQGKSAYDAQMKAFQGQIDLAQQQLDTLNGINSSVLSVKDALAQFATALGAAYAGQKNQNEAGSTASLDSQIGRIYNQVLGRNVDAGGLDFWKQKVTSGALSAGDLQKAISAGARDYISVYGIDAYRQQYGDKAAEAAMKIPAFANGGDYAGGLAMVGERGPEIINFQRPGYVYTARESAGMLSSADLSGMMALLRQLLAAVGTGNERLFWITDNSRKTATNTEVLRDRALQQEATA